MRTAYKAAREETVGERNDLHEVEAEDAADD